MTEFEVEVKYHLIPSFGYPRESTRRDVVRIDSCEIDEKNEKIIKTKEDYNPKPSDIINEILDRIEPIGKGLGLSRNNMKDMLKEGYRQHTLLEV